MCDDGRRREEEEEGGEGGGIQNQKQEPHTKMWGKTKQFCETSLIFDIDNIKNETILRDFLNF